MKDPVFFNCSSSYLNASEKAMPDTMPIIKRISPQALQFQTRQARANVEIQHVFWQIDELSLSWPGVLETIPGLNSLSIIFDSPGSLELAHKQLPSVWKKCLRRARTRTVSTLTLEVCYGGVGAPYLRQVAKLAGLSVDQWIDLHVGSTYTVANVGTHPGLACLGELVPDLQLPRAPILTPTPKRVAGAGGVAVNEFRTAIAASSLPVGWSLIGVVSKARFSDDIGSLPSLQPGDKVRFERAS
ncbi:carboxyltransferase domain-containing protein [Pseudomonas serbica]